MEIVINVPDNLSPTKIKQIIEEIEKKLQNESDKDTKLDKIPRKVYAHLIEVEDINLPLRDDLYER
jgi:transcriptional regulator NrdR family protein